MAKVQTPKKAPMEGAKKPVIDEDACIGCMACAIACEKVFRMNDSGKAEAYDPAGDTESNIQAAMGGCPTQAIRWK